MLVLNVQRDEPVHIFDGDQLILTITKGKWNSMSFECEKHIRIVRDKVLKREAEDLTATTAVDAMESAEQ